MQKSLMSTAWHDLTTSPHWKFRIFLLTLISLIPVFGWIVVFGYLYGWARDIAWDIHEPLGEIFADEDGLLLRRGFFAFIIAIVFALAPRFAAVFLESLLKIGPSHFIGSNPILPLDSFPISGLSSTATGLFAGTYSSVMLLMHFASFLMLMLAWIGCMRMSIYGRLAPGFQLGRIWSMFRHDAKNILKILGLYLLVSFCIIASITALEILSLEIEFFLVVDLGGLTPYSSEPFFSGMSPASYLMLMPILIFLPLTATVGNIILHAVTIRAVGYWVRGFDVPHWMGQDDPLPFELIDQRYAASSEASSAAAAAQAQKQPSSPPTTTRKTDNAANPCNSNEPAQESKAAVPTEAAQQEKPNSPDHSAKGEPTALPEDEARKALMQSSRSAAHLVAQYYARQPFALPPSADALHPEENESTDQDAIQSAKQCDVQRESSGEKTAATSSAASTAAPDIARADDHESSEE